MFGVADGIGGQEAGEVASGVCVQVLGDHPLLATKRHLLTSGDVYRLIDDADAAIREATGSRSGTTLSGVALIEEAGRLWWLVFNVGDSRTYLLNADGMEQVTVDHSEVQELLDMGVMTALEAAVYPRRGMLTRALGTGAKATPDLFQLPVETGGRVVICSDGLTNEVNDEQIHRIMAASPDPQQAAEALVQAAISSGGRDNATVVVINAPAQPTPEPII
ncbi:hypothetical protein GCM10027562_29130 [Arthrobacter pigmenti]